MSMTQAERLKMLLHFLLEERGEVTENIPTRLEEQAQLVRGLMNMRAAAPVPEDVLAVQDAYLQALTADKGIIQVEDLEPVTPGYYLWQGDITTLAADAIVNAANAHMRGCFIPGHHCIDNAIHTFAGMQLRVTCDAMMRAQGHEEPTGMAKITPAYNLPSRYIIHTVGPILGARLTKEDERLLAQAYTACLRLADAHALRSIAFCCISTGVFRFPNDRAADIAIETVRTYKATTQSEIKVIFNVFKDNDLALYTERL